MLSGLAVVINLDVFFRHYSRLKWKACSYQESCYYAHSKIEKEIWDLESKFDVKRNDLVNKFQLPVSQNRKQIRYLYITIYI